MDGDEIEGSYDGIAMFLDIKESLDEDMSEYDHKRFEGVYDKFKHTRLGENASPEMFSKRINNFTVHVNPYLEEPFEGEKLGKIILAQLPASLGGRRAVAQAVADRSRPPGRHRDGDS